MMGFPERLAMKDCFDIFKDLSTPVLLNYPGLLFGFLGKS